MKTPLMLIIGISAFGLGTVTADARSTDRPAMPGFEQLDGDQSGTITLEDFQTHLQTMRSGRHDQIVEKLMEQANEDGMLDEDALRTGLDALAEDRRAAMSGHRRSQGAGPRGERAEFGQRMFERIDANDDGVIDAQEYEAFTDRMQARMTRHEDRRPSGGRWGRGPKDRAQD